MKPQLAKVLVALTYIACSSLLGCASVYQAPVGKPTAQLSVSSDIMGPTGWLHHLSVQAFDDGSCAPSRYGIRLDYRATTDDDVTSSPLTIVAGEPFTYTARYTDSHYGQNRSCSATGTFTPKANGRYKAILAVEPGVESCNMGLFTVNDGVKIPVKDFSMPRYLCASSKKTSVLNGQAQWTNFRVEVISDYSKKK